MNLSNDLTKRQRIVLWMVLAAIPVLFFVALEGGLRLFEYGTDMSPFYRESWKGRDYYRVNPGVVHRYFGSSSSGTYVSRDRFLVNKPEDTFRIFCLGASTTVGYPYMYNGSYSTMIADRLSAIFPEMKFEVVNVGITAVTSFTVADLAREIIRYEPDMLVIYTGHNEFYGVLGIASTEGFGGSLKLVKAYLGLQRFKTAQLLRDALGAGAALFRSKSARGEQLMERLARDRYVPYASPDYRKALVYFRRNVEEVIEVARENEVPVLLSTLVSNLSGLPPFVSMHDPSLSTERRQEWQAEFDRARSSSDAGDCTDALQSLESSLEIDPMRADAHFELGKCRLTMGNREAARSAFAQARDLDVLRFRASSDLNHTVRSLAEAHGVPLVDMEKAFDAHPGEDVVGDALFWEHVHPRLEGYMLMAKAFVIAMAENGLVRPEEQWDLSRDWPDSLHLALSGVTTMDSVAAQLRIDLLKAHWPFSDPARPFTFEPSNEAEAMAWDYVRNRVTWARAHEELAKAYRDQGRLLDAAKELLAIGKVTTHDPTFLASAGDLFARSRQFRLAAEVFTRALDIEETATLHAKAATTRLESGDREKAVRHFERAFLLDPPLRPEIDPAMRIQFAFLAARTYLQLNDSASAARHLAWLKERAPAAPQTAALEGMKEEG